MSRLVCMVVPGLPHHVTQRGNRREAIFFEDGYQQIYCDMLAEQLRKFSVEEWACRYTNFINARGRWTGHLFQSRFASVAMDESHLRSAVSQVSLNPVRARLVSRAEEWAWSSVRAHLAGEDDSLATVRLVLDRWPTFRDLLLEEYEERLTSLREAEGIGRPLGTADFVTELERRLGRPIARRAPGRKAVAIPVGEQLNLLQQVSCQRRCHRISPLVSPLTWDDPPGVAMDEKTRERVLRNITVAFQWAGFSVGFFLLEEPESPAKQKWLLNRLKSLVFSNLTVAFQPGKPKLIKTVLQKLRPRMDDAKRFIGADSRQMRTAA